MRDAAMPIQMVVAQIGEHANARVPMRVSRFGSKPPQHETGKLQHQPFMWTNVWAILQQTAANIAGEMGAVAVEAVKRVVD